MRSTQLDISVNADAQRRIAAVRAHWGVPLRVFVAMDGAGVSMVMSAMTKALSRIAAALMVVGVPIFANQVAAQPPLVPSPSAAARAQAQELWDNYRSGRVAGRNAAEVLGRVTASKSLPATRENTNALLQALKKSGSREEKVALIRLAGAQHFASTDRQSRADIERAVASMTAVDDEVLANTAVLTYTRMGYFPDTLSIMSNARRKKVISDNDYYGDIAHLLPDVPAQERAALVKELVAGKNDFSREVLANLLKNVEFSRSFPPAEAATLLEYLGADPGFESPAHMFGGMEALRYENWLFAKVALEARVRGEPERVALVRLLKIDNADPRKLIAALWTPDGGSVLRSAFNKEALAKIDGAIANYAKTNGKDPWIQEITSTARRNLAGTTN